MGQPCLREHATFKLRASGKTFAGVAVLLMTPSTMIGGRGRGRLPPLAATGRIPWSGREKLTGKGLIAVDPPEGDCPPGRGRGR